MLNMVLEDLLAVRTLSLLCEVTAEKCQKGIAGYLGGANILTKPALWEWGGLVSDINAGTEVRPRISTRLKRRTMTGMLHTIQWQCAEINDGGFVDRARS